MPPPDLPSHNEHGATKGPGKTQPTKRGGTNRSTPRKANERYKNVKKFTRKGREGEK